MSQVHALKDRVRQAALRLYQHNYRRSLGDTLVRYFICAGGLVVVAVILFIFFYLLSVTLPLFWPVYTTELKQFQLATDRTDPPLYLATDERFSIGMRLSQAGKVNFFSIEQSAPIASEQLALPAGTQITSFAEIDPRNGWFALGLSDGRVLVAQHRYRLTFDSDNRRHIIPSVQYPLGQSPIVLDPDQRPLEQLSIRQDESGLLLAARTDRALKLARYDKSENFLSEEIELSAPIYSTLDAKLAGADVHVTADLRHLYALTPAGMLYPIDTKNRQQPTIGEPVQTLPPERKVALSALLLGDLSIMIADDRGDVHQWFRVRDEITGQIKLTGVRQFQLRAEAAQDNTRPLQMYMQQRRKEFALIDTSGTLAMFNTTAERELINLPTGLAVAHFALSPRGEGALIEDAQGQMHAYRVHGEYSDISWSALFSKVWYEGFSKPIYMWQSSASNNDFEPKFSLMPLVHGTIKAAFYAMLFAVPIAIGGAIYTAYFMAPSMRRLIKPSVEIMEALPTVILGFLAGLWFAPVLEKNLLGFCALPFALPLAIVGFSYLHSTLVPAHWRVDTRWYALLLAPYIVLIVWLTLSLGSLLELQLFGGDMPEWLNSIGITFDQRNAIVVGFAMGFAVIPTIFSISEDAILSVPKSLSMGSLALGATPWQTLYRIVLLSASPGILSAVLIGLGRAVGETIIVLMATGNTPIMHFNIFEGMRTLSANIAVELPESALGSSHYRILFLAALMLFLATFFFNTIAEVVRQHMRKKYANL